jgi:hypothetical protein
MSSNLIWTYKISCVRVDKDFTFDDRFAKAFADSIHGQISFAQESRKGITTMPPK